METDMIFSEKERKYNPTQNQHCRNLPRQLTNNVGLFTVISRLWARIQVPVNRKDRIVWKIQQQYPVSHMKDHKSKLALISGHIYWKIQANLNVALAYLTCVYRPASCLRQLQKATSIP